MTLLVMRSLAVIRKAVKLLQLPYIRRLGSSGEVAAFQNEIQIKPHDMHNLRVHNRNPAVENNPSLKDYIFSWEKGLEKRDSSILEAARSMESCTDEQVLESTWLNLKPSIQIGPDLSDIELLALLRFLKKDIRSKKLIAQEDAMSVLNMIEAECIRRIKDFSLNVLLQLGLEIFDTNFCENFKWVMTKRLARIMERLSKSQYIAFMAFIPRYKSLPKAWGLYTFEHKLLSFMDDLNVEDICLVSDAFSAIKIPIHDTGVIKQMIDKFIRSAQIIEPRHLNCLAKGVMRSSQFGCEENISQLFTTFAHSVKDMDLFGCGNFIMLSVKMKVFNESVFSNILTKVESELAESAISMRNLPAIAKIVQCFAIMNFDFRRIRVKLFENFETLLQQDQASMHGKHIYSALAHMMFQDSLPAKVCAMCLDPLTLKRVYGKSGLVSKVDPLLLHWHAVLEIPDYEGPLLPEKKKFHLTKKFMTWMSDDCRMGRFEKNCRDLLSHFIDLYKTEEPVFHIFNVLPHLLHYEIVFCTNKQGDLCQIPSTYKYEECDIKFIPEGCDDLSFHAITVTGFKDVIFETKSLTGRILLKKRLLEKLGYKTVVMRFDEWITIKEKEKAEIDSYVKNLFAKVTEIEKCQ